MNRLVAIESPSSAVASRVPATKSAWPGPPTASAICPSIAPTGNCGSRMWTTSPVLACGDADVRPDRAALLRQAGHVQHRDALALERRRGAEQRPDGDHAGAAD